MRGLLAGLIVCAIAGMPACGGSKSSSSIPNAGYLNVTVAPIGVSVAYVRAVLPGDERKVGLSNGAVALSYTVAPPPRNEAPAGRASGPAQK